MRHRVNAVGRMAKFKVVSHQATGADMPLVMEMFTKVS